MKQFQHKYNFDIFCRITLAVLSTLLLIVVFGNSNVASAAETSPWKVDFNNGGKSGDGIELTYLGIPVIYKSTLNAVKPGWNGYFYRQDKEKPGVKKDSNGTLHVTDKNEYFHSEYELRPVSATTFQIHFRGELLKEANAQLELNLGYFNANLLADRPYTATEKGTGKTTKGIVTYPKKEGLFNNDLAPGFETLTFDSRLGRMNIKTESKESFIFGDARNYPHLSDTNPPLFWLGVSASLLPLKVNQPVEATVVINIEPTEGLAAQNRQELSLTPELINDAHAIDLNQRPIQVVPQPKEMSVDTKKYFLLKDSTKWNIVAPKGEKRLAPALQNLLINEWNFDLNKPTTTESSSKEWSAIRIGSDAPISFPSELTHAEWATHESAYQIIVDKDGVAILSPSAEGAFYGVQTLAQLLRLNDNGEITIPFTKITDWPTLQFRSIHWNPTSAVNLSKKFIHVAARYKYNYAIIDLWRVQWKFNPETSDKIGVNNEEMRELAELCRANFIEPIPLLNGPGHATWMFIGGHNADLREDPKSNWAYSVNNPKTAAYVQKAMSEIIDAMKPQYFHIGADEFNMHGRVPNPDNPRNPKGTTLTDLLLKSINTRHDWLAKQGIKTMIWGDLFVNNKAGGRGGANAKSEKIASERRKALPKDVIVVDWNYRPGDFDKKKDRLQSFQKEGLEVVAGTWYNPMNIYDFTHAAIDSNAKGIVQTTWGTIITEAEGLSRNSVGIKQHMFNIWPMAADYAWSGRKELPEDLPYDPAALWDETYSIPNKSPQKGALVDLSNAAQVDAKNWLSLSKGQDLTGFYRASNNEKIHRFGGIDYQLTPGKFTVISSAPQRMAPEGAIGGLTLDIGKKAKVISFIHSSLWDTAGGRHWAVASGLRDRSVAGNVNNGVIVAKAIIEYSDGTKAEVSFIEGAHIASWQGRDAALGTVAWKGKSPTGMPLTLSQYKWKNPHPDKSIKSLILEPVDKQAGYVLAGLTLIQ